ncbi:MAG: glycerol-3-phosphate dehydrogenase/oxidase [Rhodomicrobiaceae bacterium]
MPEQRDDNLEQIRRNGAFDVIVVGGGINGIGTFRELALQGLRVLLVERNDFCSGCSAAPSRMIHGGLRYLENGEFALVRESLRERDALLRNAPHMVRPLATTIPITSVFSGLLNGMAGFFGFTSKPASRGALPIKIGLSLYDWVTRRRRLLPPHRFRGARKTLERWPALTPRLRFSATYHDAWISYPERLGIELVLDAIRAAPDCIALNHAEISPSDNGFAVTDNQTGETMPVTAKAFVNATGAWLDEAASELAGSRTNAEHFVSGTKGSHLILDCAPLYEALDGHMIFFENADGRVCIVFPYLGKVLAGATDIRVDKVSRVRCEPEERDYILDALRLVFPGIALSADNVVFSFSGIRPLPKSDHEFTGRIPRAHFVHRLDDPVPQFCMVSGKWTTFRAFAEQTADAVLDELGRKRVTDTLELAIGGGAGFPEDAGDLELDLVERYGISPERAACLTDAYGTRANEVLAFCRSQNNDEPLGETSPITAAEIVFLIRREFVLGLSDLLLRRTALAITGKLSMPIIEKVAEIAAAELGWDDVRTVRETEAFIEELGDYYGVSRVMLDQRTRERSLACA